MAATFRGVIDQVHTACINLGMNISPSDVGFIVQSFFQSIVDNPDGPPWPAPVHDLFQSIADEAGQVKDE